MKTATVVMAVMTLGLVGCATEGQEPVETVVGLDPIQQKIAAATERASNALNELARIEIESSRALKNANTDTPSYVPSELKKEITLDWVGPIEPLVRKLSEEVGYGFLFLGNQPATPIIIKVRADKQRMIDVLRDIGLQVGDKAKLVVDAEPKRKIFEVQYAAR